MAKFVTKPPAGAQINWANPITRGLVFYHVARSWTMGELTRGGLPTGTLVTEIGQLGEANRGITYPDNGFLDFGGADWSIGFWAKVSGTPTNGVNGTVLLHSTDISGATNRGYMIVAAAADSGFPSKWYLDEMNNGHFQAASATNWNAFSDVFVLFTCEDSTDTVKVYINGQLDNSTVVAVRGHSAGTMGYQLGVSATNMDILFYQTFTWRRLIAPSEAASLYANKWQMLAPVSPSLARYATASMAASKAYYYAQTQGLR